MYTPHVLAMDVGQTFKVTTSDQTTHNIHPTAQSDDRQYPVESVAAAGSAAGRKELEGPEVIPVQCNIHPWMHGWFVVVKGPYATTDSNGSLHHQQRAARKLHRDGVAGRLRHPDAKGDGCGGAAGNCGFHL